MTIACQALTYLSKECGLIIKESKTIVGIGTAKVVIDREFDGSSKWYYNKAREFNRDIYYRVKELITTFIICCLIINSNSLYKSLQKSFAAI